MSTALAQSDGQAGNASDQFAGMLDSFLAEPVELSEEQHSLLNDPAYNYAEDPAVTAEVRKHWLDVLLGTYKSESAVEQLEKVLGPANLEQLVGEYWKGSGFKAANNFDVQAIDLITNMMMAQGLRSTHTEGDVLVRDMLVTTATSEKILARRELGDDVRQKNQQLYLLALLWKLQIYINALDSGQPLDGIQERAQERLIGHFGVDPRFQAITPEGLGLKQELIDVVTGRAELDTVYPDLDLVALSASGSSKVARVVAGTLQLLDKSEAELQELANEKNAAVTQADNQAAPDSQQAPVTESQSVQTEVGGGNNPPGAAPEAVNPLAVGISVSPFSGNWKGDGLQLSADVVDGSATGMLTFNGLQYSLEGVVDEQTLKGTFTTASGEFPFKAALIDNKIRFDTSGVAYELLRQ